MINNHNVSKIATYVISAYTCNCIAHNMSNYEIQQQLYIDKYNYVDKAIAMINKTHCNVHYHYDNTTDCVYFVFNLYGKELQISFHKSGRDYEGYGHKEIEYNGAYGSTVKRALQRAFGIKPECSGKVKNLLLNDKYYITNHEEAVKKLVDSLIK